MAVLIPVSPATPTFCTPSPGLSNRLRRLWMGRQGASGIVATTFSSAQGGGSDHRRVDVSTRFRRGTVPVRLLLGLDRTAPPQQSDGVSPCCGPFSSSWPSLRSCSSSSVASVEAGAAESDVVSALVRPSSRDVAQHSGQQHANRLRGMQVAHSGAVRLRPGVWRGARATAARDPHNGPWSWRRTPSPATRLRRPGTGAAPPRRRPSRPHLTRRRRPRRTVLSACSRTTG